MTLNLHSFVRPCVWAVALAMTSGLAFADRDKDRDRDDGNTIHAHLKGFNEVPSVSTAGSGEFTGTIDPVTNAIDYHITYSGIQGNVLMSHMHFGQRSVNGGIAVWFCQTATNPAPAAVAATTPTCTPTNGSFTGTITAASIIGPGATQQLGAGELQELIAAIHAGVTYVNVHSSISPGGEIRGQVRHRR